ncbi:disulfide bond formation protein DsbA [Pantoea vagans]|nr:disulfide bond formation protein DsbA [Pantoea vagans]
MSEPQPAVTDRNATQKSAQAPAAESLFTPEQEARIGELAKAYLMKHPELLIEVDQKLQKIQYEEQMKAMTTAAIQHQDELLNDNTVPAIGPEGVKVAVIEFFDYQCSVCARQAPIIQSLMKNNPQVRFIFKEWPIFGYRWKPSFQAAETGLRIWQQKGGDAYMTYHNALFASGHIEGALTQKDITKAASAAGAGKLKSNDMLGTLSRTDILAKNTGFQGTPAMIVMPLSGATAETVTIYPGGAMEEMLQSAINKALGQAGK